MSTSKTLVVASTVDSDVSLDVFAEIFTDLIEGFLLSASPHNAIGEVGVHSGTIPITWDGFWGQVH